MPRLGAGPPSANGGRSASTTVSSSLKSLLSLHPERPRRETLKVLLLRSVRLRVAPFGSAGRSSSRGRNRAGGGEDEPEDLEERLDGVRRGQLPLRVRPAFILLNVLCLLGLAFLGFHPRGQDYVPINDKLLHFICFLLATGLFYFIWDVDEPARRVWIWRHMALLLTWIVCFAAGGLGSEIVQSLLPYKTFQWLDVLANFAGSALGLFFSYHAEKRYRTRREIERLYEPLDQEVYGDDDDEDGEGHYGDTAFGLAGDGERDPWSAVDEDGFGGIGRRPTSTQKSRGADERRVRFGEDQVWGSGEQREDSAADTSDRQSQAQRGNAPSSQSPEDSETGKVAKQNLFSIDDDDDDGDGGGGDVWKDAK